MGTNYKLLSVPPMFWITSQRMIVSPLATCTEAFDFPANSLTLKPFCFIKGHPAGARVSFSLNFLGSSSPIKPLVPRRMRDLDKDIFLSFT